MELVDIELHCRKNRLRSGHFTVELLNLTLLGNFSGLLQFPQKIFQTRAWGVSIWHLAASILRTKQGKRKEGGVNIQHIDIGLISFSLGHLTSALSLVFLNQEFIQLSFSSLLLNGERQWPWCLMWGEDLVIYLILVKTFNKSSCFQLSSHPSFQHTWHLQFLNPSRPLWHNQIPFSVVSSHQLSLLNQFPLIYLLSTF